MEKTSHIQFKHDFPMQSNSYVLVRMADYGAVLVSISPHGSLLGSFEQNRRRMQEYFNTESKSRMLKKRDRFIFQVDFSELSHSKQTHQPMLTTNSRRVRLPRRRQQQLAHLRQAANRCCSGSVASSSCCSPFSDEAIASAKVLRTVPLTSKINTSWTN